MKFPNYDSIGFKCQQNKNLKVKSIGEFFGKPGKVIRLSDNVANQNDVTATDPIPMEIDLVPKAIASNSDLIVNKPNSIDLDSENRIEAFENSRSTSENEKNSDHLPPSFVFDSNPTQ